MGGCFSEESSLHNVSKAPGATSCFVEAGPATELVCERIHGKPFIATLCAGDTVDAFLQEIIARCHRDVKTHHFTQLCGKDAHRLVLKGATKKGRNSVVLLNSEDTQGWYEIKEFLRRTTPRLSIVKASSVLFEVSVAEDVCTPHGESAADIVGEQWRIFRHDLDRVDSILEFALGCLEIPLGDAPMYRLQMPADEAIKGTTNAKPARSMNPNSTPYDYQLKTMVTRGGDGKDETVTPLRLIRIAVPNTPRSLRVQDAPSVNGKLAAPGTIALSWECDVALDTAPVVSFIVSVDPTIAGDGSLPEQAQWEVTPGLRCRGFTTVLGLIEGVTYTFHICAENEAGKGESCQIEYIAGTSPHEAESPDDPGGSNDSQREIVLQNDDDDPDQPRWACH